MLTPRSTRPGSIHAAWTFFLATGLVLVALVGALYWLNEGGPTTPTNQPLQVFCAAGIRGPIEAAAKAYEEEYGARVELQYGASMTLLAAHEVSKQGDLYIPADDYYVELARTKKLGQESLPLAVMTPVLAVPKGNPKQIQSLDQILSGNLRFAQVNPEAGAIGKLTRDNLQAADAWQALAAKTTVFTPNVQEVVVALKLGSVDAGIVWDALVQQNPSLEAVAIPQLAAKKGHVSACVLASSRQPTAALRFARYLAAPEKGLKYLEQNGFKPVDGDVWAEQPELRLFAGAMLRPAIEKTIVAFEQREGVAVKCVYNGCGILVGQMKVGSIPDAYFACETGFMKQVNDLFLEAHDISSNQLVIVVPKGNPYGIKTLPDLGKPDLRLGVGHEQQCALGAITQATLIEGKVQDPVMKNVKVRSPTGDMLVNQLRTGSLDAVIAYISNTAGHSDIEAFTINGLPCAIAVQPMAVARASQHKYLAGRLMEMIRTQESRQQFESYGFGWKDAK